MRYNLMKQFDSLFSMRIYELLIRWKNTTHKKFTIELGELKIKLGVKGKYKEFKDFDLTVLKTAKREINELSDITMEYAKLALGEAKGKGRKPITHIEFSFKMKNERQEEEVLEEKQIKELMEIAERRALGTDKTANEFYNYGFSLALEGCNNNKGFYKYIKSIITNDKVFLGQTSLLINPDVRAVAKQKSIQIQNQMIKEKKELREQGQAELDAIYEHIEREKEERRKKIKKDSVI